MLMNIIDARLETYQSNTIEDEEHSLKEILQEIALYGLASTDFFDKAIFHGGSALRIIYGLPRFSEDLDFLLKKPDPNFKWEKAAEDVAPFLNHQDKQTLQLWGTDFFLNKLSKLEEVLSQ